MFHIKRMIWLNQVNGEIAESWHSFISKLSDSMVSMSLLNFTFTMATRLLLWAQRKRKRWNKLAERRRQPVFLLQDSSYQELVEQARQPNVAEGVMNHEDEHVGRHRANCVAEDWTDSDVSEDSSSEEPLSTPSRHVVPVVTPESTPVVHAPDIHIAPPLGTVPVVAPGYTPVVPP
jgi:hypothetical protein